MMKPQTKRKYLLGDESGMTLVEAMGGLVILALSLVLIYSGFLIADKIFNDGDDLELQSQGAFASLEKGTAIGSDATVSVPLGSETVTFAGQYMEVSEEGTKISLYSFETTQTDTVADGVRETFMYWLNIFTAMTESERVANGYPRFISNSACRNWISQNIYDNAWPTLSAQFLEQNGITGTTLYVQPYYYAATGDVFIFAKTGVGDGWYTRFVYDHEEQTWYLYSGGGISVNQSWATIKTSIHTSSWSKMI